MLKRLFGFDPAQNSVRTEVFAGITSFLTMSYILAVNPQLFASLDGMPRGAVFTTTALIAVLGSLLMAIVAKLPFGVAPGMGSNTFFVFAGGYRQLHTQVHTTGSDHRNWLVHSLCRLAEVGYSDSR